MANFTEFNYGAYPSDAQLLTSNIHQSAYTDETSTTAMNKGALSPRDKKSECCLNPSNTKITDSIHDSNTSQTKLYANNPATNILGSDTLSQASSGCSINRESLNPTETTTIGGINSNKIITESCCENGRPIMTDSISGQTICSCQYDSARLALSTYTRLPGDNVGLYGNPYPSNEQNPYQSIGVDNSAFYSISPLSNPYGLKDSTSGADITAWASAGLQSSTTGYYSYDPMSAYGYSASYDLTSRRKNATRESTATLKAWLSEHKKNPYPTKGEKIMLAIITKMTLTQVSTWFANARRRLKKDNKMTWEPKNRTDNDDDENCGDGDGVDGNDSDADDVGDGGVDGDADGIASNSSKDRNILSHEKTLQNPLNRVNTMSSSSHRDQDKMGLVEEDAHHHHHYQQYNQHNPLRYTNEMRIGLNFPAPQSSCHPHSYHPYHQHSNYYQHHQHQFPVNYAQMVGIFPGGDLNKYDHTISKNPLHRDDGSSIPASKPKIWSLADTVANKTPPPLPAAVVPPQPPPQFLHTTEVAAEVARSSQLPLTLQQAQSLDMEQQKEHQKQQQLNSHAQAELHYQLQQQRLWHSMQQLAGEPQQQIPQKLQLSNFNQQTTNNIVNSGNSVSNRSHSNNCDAIRSDQMHFGLSGNSYSNNYEIASNSATSQHQIKQQQTKLVGDIQKLSEMNQRLNHDMGFPEVHPDTPPQTPPNMKIMSGQLAMNLLNTVTSVTMNESYAINNSNNNSNNNNNYNRMNNSESSNNIALTNNKNYNRFPNNYSPLNENSDGLVYESNKLRLQKQ